MGWRVADLAAHVVGLALDVVNAKAGSRTPEEQVAGHRGRSQSELADELATAVATLRPLLEALDDDAWAGPSPAPHLTMRQGVLTL